VIRRELEAVYRLPEVKNVSLLDEFHARNENFLVVGEKEKHTNEGKIQLPVDVRGS